MLKNRLSHNITRTLSLAFLLSIITLQLSAQTVSTLAGSGDSGSNNGLAASATFNTPQGVAVDASGNVYVADIGNNKIRKISIDGNVSTLSGTGEQGSAEGASASFNHPMGVAVDGLGNVYVTDYWNHKIRKITAGGVVSTFAGSGTPGSANGTGAAASFNYPLGIAIDANGNLYITDSQNQKIRKITKEGVVTTLAGSGAVGYTNGSGSTATFNGPAGVAVDAAGNVYVAEANNAIRKITSQGVVSTLAGNSNGDSGSADGAGTAASFNNPTGVTIDVHGNIYVTDLDNYKIRKITNGIVSTVAGDGSYGKVNGPASTASFEGPNGIAVDASGLYIGDQGNNMIRKITELVITGVEQEVSDEALINVYPNPASDKVNVTLSEKMNGTITILDMSGKVMLTKTFKGSSITLPTTELANGIYSLKISSSKKSIAKQISIVR